MGYTNEDLERMRKHFKLDEHKDTVYVYNHKRFYIAGYDDVVYFLCGDIDKLVTKSSYIIKYYGKFQKKDIKFMNEVPVYKRAPYSKAKRLTDDDWDEFYNSISNIFVNDSEHPVMINKENPTKITVKRLDLCIIDDGIYK